VPPRSKASESPRFEATLWDAANKLRGNMDPRDKREEATDLVLQQAELLATDWAA
jgi:hypothetical protein